ncbi:hypothetical protein ASG01_08930 [Chryseobacterium sp. Leaf180]|uniref:hypothetical protein n=1 Tax=Chryseobacterium sp. Leaf180 TaxID=1736289 RepID=UPI0006F65F6A|nr:hypothetical protein [Chryseobacterium sp. Leaf180]KQR93311.1 hypothetical protein ASG01_08930 [Chryseobacterium sp. Leaf180]
MTKTTFHSKEVEAFKNYCEGWDSRIHTYDDRDTQQNVNERLFDSVGKLENFLLQSDQKAMTKARGTLMKGTDEANEKEVLAMFENQKRGWYKQMREIIYNLNFIQSVSVALYELKNRYASECFKLRSENAQLRGELEKYKHNG